MSYNLNPTDKLYEAKKLSAFQCWVIKQRQNLSNDAYRELLLNNGIINQIAYKVGDIINVMSFGSPAKEKLIEWDCYKEMFKCQPIGGNGSSWRTIGNILSMEERVKEYLMVERKFRYSQNGGNNGPTGHGDICYSDSDPGL